MHDLQYEVLKEIKKYDITSIDIDYIKDKQEYRIGFGRLTESFYDYDINKQKHYMTDFECNFQKILDELAKTSKDYVVVGFKNMMYDLYTIITGQRPTMPVHLGVFPFNDDTTHEEEKLLSVLREISLINKIIFQLRLNRTQKYNTTKSIRIGKYYLKNFKTIFTIKTNYKPHKELKPLQKEIFKQLEMAYKEYNTKPILFLIPDKTISGLTNGYIRLETVNQFDEVKTKDEKNIKELIDNAFKEYFLNNILRNSLLNLIVFLIRTKEPKASDKWNKLVKELQKVSWLSDSEALEDGVLPPSFINSYTSASIFITDKMMNTIKVARILFELYILSKTEQHRQAQITRQIIELIDNETLIRFYELYFTLKEAGGKEIRVNFSELESIFKKSLSKMGEYFGLYKMKYSQDLTYLYNDVYLHLILTYTKMLIIVVMKKIAPEQYKRLEESDESLNIENIYKILVSKYFTKDDIFKMLKVNKHTISLIKTGLLKHSINPKTYQFTIYNNNEKQGKDKLLLSKASFLTLNTMEFLKHLRIVDGLVVVESKLEIYAPTVISAKLLQFHKTFQKTTITNKEQAEKVYRKVAGILHNLQHHLNSDSEEFNVKPLIMIEAEPVSSDKMLIKPPKLITPKTLTMLAELGVRMEAKKIFFIIESNQHKERYDKASENQLNKLRIVTESLNIISTIPLPYSHLISNILKEFIQEIDVFQVINYLIKNKFMTRGNARYIHPELKEFSYLILSYISALAFRTILSTMNFIDKQYKLNKTYIIMSQAKSISLTSDLIINTTMTDRKGTTVLNGLIKYYSLKTTNVKIYYMEKKDEQNNENSTIQMPVFSIPIQHIVINNQIPEQELVDMIKYNLILNYIVEKKGNKINAIIRTSNRIN